jgi:apolipoprotein N-acyltransferase
MAPIASRLASLRAGWRLALAWALGAVGMLGLPPFGFVPALAVAFAGLVWLLDAACDGGARAGRRAFWTGWAFTFGHLVVGLYWIALALLVDAAKFAWLVPFAVLVLPAGLALFGGAATWAAARFWGRGAGRVLVLAVAWSLAEWLRGHVLTGFPWNVVGYAWADLAAPRQAAALVGIWGLSLGTVALSALPATLADPERHGWRRAAPLALGLAALGAVSLFGWARLDRVPPPDGTGPQLRIVQGNVAQAMKWSEAERQNILLKYLRLSQTPAARPPAAVIWPETATPYVLDTVPENAVAVAQAAPPDGLLLTGAVRVRDGATDADFQAWNSLIVLDAKGSVIGSYDKAHLVPFGEYLPLRSILSRVGIDKLAQGAVDFSSGPGPRTLHIPGLPPFSPLICYEAIFPGAVADRTDPPAWLLNVTNDAWFGTSIGPYQHLAMARMRAVEQGVPLVRAANTGVSAVFDSVGREIGRLGLSETGVLDIALPSPVEGGTPYGRHGDWVYAGLVLAVAALAWRTRFPAP